MFVPDIDRYKSQKMYKIEGSDEVEYLYYNTIENVSLGTHELEAKKQATMTIQNVPYGEHLLEAVRPSDDTKVASITIDIDENKEYYWIISK